MGLSFLFLCRLPTPFSHLRSDRVSPFLASSYPCLGLGAARRPPYRVDLLLAVGAEGLSPVDRKERSPGSLVFEMYLVFKNCHSSNIHCVVLTHQK